MTQRWDAARSASKRPLRRYKPCGPVCTDREAMHAGELATLAYCRLNSRGRAMTGDDTCVDCGYHVCSCQPGLDYTACERCEARTEALLDGLCWACAPESPTTPPKPLSACYFGTVTGKAFHSYDCGSGKHRCRLEEKP